MSLSPTARVFIARRPRAFSPRRLGHGGAEEKAGLRIRAREELRGAGVGGTLGYLIPAGIRRDACALTRSTERQTGCRWAGSGSIFGAAMFPFVFARDERKRAFRISMAASW